VIFSDQRDSQNLLYKPEETLRNSVLILFRSLLTLLSDNRHRKIKLTATVQKVNFLLLRPPPPFPKLRFVPKTTWKFGYTTGSVLYDLKFETFTLVNFISWWQQVQNSCI